MKVLKVFVVAFFLLLSLYGLAYSADCPTLPGCPDCGHLYWHPWEMESTWWWDQGNSPVRGAPVEWWQASFGFFSFFWPPDHPDIPQPTLDTDLMALDCSYEPWSEQLICSWVEVHLFHVAPYPEGIVTMWVGDPNGGYNYLGIIDFYGGTGEFIYNVGGVYSEMGNLRLFCKVPLDEDIMRSILGYLRYYRMLPIRDMP